MCDRGFHYDYEGTWEVDQDKLADAPEIPSCTDDCGILEADIVVIRSSHTRLR